MVSFLLLAWLFAVGVYGEIQLRENREIQVSTVHTAITTLSAEGFSTQVALPNGVRLSNGDIAILWLTEDHLVIGSVVSSDLRDVVVGETVLADYSSVDSGSKYDFDMKLSFAALPDSRIVVLIAARHTYVSSGTLYAKILNADLSVAIDEITISSLHMNVDDDGCP